MRKILKLFFNRYYTNGKRTIDILLFCWRKYIDWVYHISFGLFAFNIIMFIFRWRLPNWVFISLFIFLFVNMALVLYIGVWHSNVTSRQIFVLFEKYDTLKRAERKKIIGKYAIRAALAAVLISSGLYVLTINNFILSLINRMYDVADNYLKYMPWSIPNGSQTGIVLSYHTLKPLIGADWFNSLLLLTPIGAIGLIFYNSYATGIAEKTYEKLVEQWLGGRYFQDSVLSNIVHNQDEKGQANLVMGLNSKTGEQVILHANERTYHTIIFGLIGTGKSATILIPAMLQDMENMKYYLLSYRKYLTKVDEELEEEFFNTEFERKKKRRELLEQWYNNGYAAELTNGIYMTEPSGSMYGTIVKYAHKMGFPDEMIWTLDPTNPGTGAINILDGDTTQVKGAVRDLFKRFSDPSGTGSSFFLNQEGQLTDNIITVIKEVALIPDAPINYMLKGKSPTLTEFSNMLRSSDWIEAYIAVFEQLLNRKKRLFEETLKKHEEFLEQEKEKWLEESEYNREHEQLFDTILRPENVHEAINAFNDERNKLENLQSSYDYFINAHQLNSYTEEYYYTFDANVSGLKAVIDDLSSSPEIRRVFFSQSTKDLDIVLKTGGMILVNSAKGVLGKEKSRMVAQMVTLVMQNAAQRRLPDKSPFFAFYEDEKNGYLMPGNDSNFLDESRKFHVPVMHAYQHDEQIRDSIGESGADAIKMSYRNAFTFQQTSTKVVEFINLRSGGKHYALKETKRAANDDLLAGNQGNSSATSEEVVEEDNFTARDANNLEKFQVGGVIVSDDEVSNMIYLTTSPHFEMDISKDSFVSHTPFNKVYGLGEEEPEIAKAYKLWRAEVIEYYAQKESESHLYESDFTEEEWQAIMDVKVPNVDRNVNDTVGKKDDSPSVKRTILVNDSITEHREGTSIREEVTEDIEQKEEVNNSEIPPVVEEKQTVNSKNDIGELKDKEITQRVILAPSSTPETVDTQNIQAPNQEFELPQELSRVAREKATRTLESNVEQMAIDEEEGF